MNVPGAPHWLAALERRHLADLTLPEVARALRALSSTYVERRERLERKTAFDSGGKRAAYALYYSPLHYLTVGAILHALGDAHDIRVRHLLDLGCGAGAAGAAWATFHDNDLQSTGVEVTAVDSHPWALTEAAFTYRSFQIPFRTRRADAARTRIDHRIDAVVAGWMLNELSDAARDAVQIELLAAARRGTQILIVEPIATRVSPWWPEWTRAFTGLGGRADEWKFDLEFPDLMKRLAQAAGLSQGEVKARTLYIGRSRA